MSEDPLPGPLDEFLNRPLQAEPSELRGTLLEKTTSHVRRRRRVRLVRRWVIIGVVEAALIALTVILASQVGRFRNLWEDEKGQRGEAIAGPRIEARAKPGPGPLDEHQPKSPPPPAAAPLTPLALEWKAFDAPVEQQWALYREAGDRYFEDANDLASALRCYKQAFQRAPMSTLTIDRNDNWMVTALKLDQIERRKEN
jgi:hypothetical protein